MTVIQIVGRGQVILCPHFKKTAICISKRQSSVISKRKASHHFEKRGGWIISKWDLSFRKVHHPSFRKGRALSFQNDSFAWDLSMINLNDSFRNDRGSVILKWHWFWIIPIRTVCASGCRPLLFSWNWYLTLITYKWNAGKMVPLAEVQRNIFPKGGDAYEQFDASFGQWQLRESG